MNPFMIYSIILLLLYNNIKYVESTHCDKTEDCYKHKEYNIWCNSGVICIENSCRKVPGVPCLHTQLCLKNLDQCIDIPCETDKECDDGIYCNGMEECIAGLCNPGGDNCDSDICSENNMICIWPMEFMEWKVKHQKAIYENIMHVLSSPPSKIDNINNPPSIKNHNATPGGIDITNPGWQIFFIVAPITAIVIGIGVCFCFLMGR